ncbi:hypothetical protein BU16DRAFT_522597 [Lophium mytilinum]|uniref:Uncharacterized protein n=1 Tax=Lophium mytilinum TaxID=390894 RepID=A0A6A6RBF1_9PEZI|nr:hypothetical protein BU16DRAFT_522597 [Lophium mytilinum]
MSHSQIKAIKDAVLDPKRQIPSYSKYLVEYDDGTEGLVPAATVAPAMAIKYLTQYPPRAVKLEDTTVANDIKAYNNKSAVYNSDRAWPKPNAPVLNRNTAAVPLKARKASTYSTTNMQQNTRPPAPTQCAAARRDSVAGQSSAPRRRSSTPQGSRSNTTLAPERTPERTRLTAPGHDDYELPPEPARDAERSNIPDLRKNSTLIIVDERPSKRDRKRSRITTEYLIYRLRDNMTGKKRPLVWVSDKAVHARPKAEWAASGRQKLFSAKQVLEKRAEVRDAVHRDVYGY